MGEQPLPPEIERWLTMSDKDLNAELVDEFGSQKAVDAIASSTGTIARVTIDLVAAQREAEALKAENARLRAALADIAKTHAFFSDALEIRKKAVDALKQE